MGLAAVQRSTQARRIADAPQNAPATEPAMQAIVSVSPPMLAQLTTVFSKSPSAARKRPRWRPTPQRNWG